MTVFLLDIEGTTTSISFVYDVLFPYARTHMASYLERMWRTEDTRKIVEIIRSEAASDERAGAGLPAVDPGDGEPARASVVAYLLAQMDADRKATGLKALQGRVWEAGYRSGELRGHVFADVPPALARWTAAGHAAWIYSSGSVAAQRLLFAHSVAGDLTPLLSGYFDTTTGPKKEPASYAAIARAVGVPPSEVCFVTDNLDEAHASRDAGMNVRVSVRPGNPPLEPHDFVTITSFDTLA